MPPLNLTFGYSFPTYFNPLENRYLLTAASITAFAIWRFWFSPSEEKDTHLKNFIVTNTVDNAITNYIRTIEKTNYFYKRNVPFFILLQTISTISIPSELEDTIIKKIQPLWDDLFINVQIPNSVKYHIYAEDRAVRYDGDQQDYIRRLITEGQLNVPDFLKKKFMKL